MPVEFDGADDAITLALGSLGFAFGPGSIAVVCFPDANNTVRNLLHVGTNSGSTRYGLNVSGSDVLRMQIGSGSRTAPTIVLSEGEWQLLGCSKATGTVACRFHKYLWSSNTHSHEDDDVTGASSGVPTGDAFVGNVVGSAGTDAWLGEILMGAIWDVELSDAQFEALPHSLQAWFAPAQPKLLFFLDQESTSLKVLDVSGNGSSESARTGTAIDGRSAPPFASGAEAILAELIAAGGQTFTVDLAGTVTPAGALAKLVSKPLAGSVSPSGALAKQAGKPLAGTITPAGALTKQPQKELAGSVAPSGAITRSVSKLFAGTVTPEGALAKSTSKSLAGSVTPSGLVSLVKVVLIFLGGTVTPTGTLTRRTDKGLAGTVTPSGALAKTTSKSLAGTVAPVGSLLKAIGKFLSGLVTPSGTVATSVSGPETPVTAHFDAHIPGPGIDPDAPGASGFDPTSPSV